MKKLIILRGAMGCGKSTFIKENNLENYTLSSDQIRLMFTSPEMTIDMKEAIPQYNNKKVWLLLFYLLEERMKKGELTIIDAVHKDNETLMHYKKLAEKYRYRLYIIDFTFIPKEEVLKRNLNRESYKIVPSSAIDKTYKAFSKNTPPRSFQILKPDEFHKIIENTPRNFNNYDSIHIIGDIHGCATSLKKYFIDNPFNKKEAYIFLGDYFDRGLENCETYSFLNELMINDNTIFLMGNHEDKLYKYACDDDFKLDYDIKKTIEEFEEKGLTKSEIRGFIKKLSQIAYINFNGKLFLLSHGGVPYFPNTSLDFYSTNSYVYGIDNYEVDIDKIYNDHMKNQKQKVYQIHGHRNFGEIKYDKYSYSLNLDGDVENGGYLRILTLNKDGHVDYLEIKNDTFNKNLKEETSIYNLINEFNKNEYVYTKDLGNNIYSFNFKKEAFYNKIWNDITTKARGLFIDTLNNKIIARSYNKFFNINERKETSLKALQENLTYPISFFLKYNGFLGILSVHNDEIFFASKSTNTGSYVDYFKSIFYQKFNEKQIELIKNKMIKDNLSIVFEVIDPINDPHIIEYQNTDIIMLDMIYNREEIKKIPYETLEDFSKLSKVKIKEKAFTADNFEEFTKVYETITSPNFKLNNTYVEGFVIEDHKGYMLKVKTGYYNTWKTLRSKMENALKNHKFESQNKSTYEEQFMNYLKNKYENKDYDLSSINVIQERKMFEKSSK